MTRRVRRAALAAAAWLAACGGAPSPEVRRAGGDGDPAEATEAAAQAWAALDPERAAREAERARRLAGPGEDARDASEIAARAHLALGRWDAAVRATEGTSDPALLRLRARAQIGAGELAEAAETLGVAAAHAREPDPWTQSVLPALRAAGARPYELVGEAASLPLEPLALPVVRVQVDAVEVLALVATGAWLAVLDPSVRRAPGAIDELGLGALRVRSVPHTVRSLEAVREALGAEIGAVIGADLLMRLSATLDGPGGALRLHAAPPARPDTTTAPLLTLTGSFLAIEARRGEARAWLTLDTAGLFPLALAPAGVEALGLTEAAWTPSDVGPELTLADVRMGALAAEAVPIVRGILDGSHGRAIGAPVAGAVGWVVLSQLPITFDGRARALRFEATP